MFQDYFNHASQLIYIIAAEGFVTEVNNAAVELTGIEKTDILGKALWELPCWLHSEQMQNMVLFSMEQCAMTMENARFAAQYKDYKDDIVDLDFVFKPVFNENETIDYFVGLAYNITELVKARRALSDQERQMNALFENANDGFLFSTLPESVDIKSVAQDELIRGIIAYQKITRCNQSFNSIYGLSNGDAGKSSSSYELLNIDVDSYYVLIKEMLEKGQSTTEINFVNKRGERKTVGINFSPILQEDHYYGNFCVISDKTLTRAYEVKLKAMASTDFLTGLKNRRTFFDMAQPLCNPNDAVAVVMFDIDKFKAVNDTYGHDTGDIVLKNFATLLAKSFDPYGITSRLGGEEFAVLINKIPSKKAIALLEEFREKLSNTKHKTKQGNSICVSVSIGVLLLNTNVQENLGLDTALNWADVALYNAKSSGRNQVKIYERTMEKK